MLPSVPKDTSNDAPRTVPSSPWAWIGAITIASVAGWTGMAEGAWCSPSSHA